MPSLPLKPFWSTNDGTTVRLYLGHVLDVLRRLPAKSVHMAVTSPPYWGLRSYLKDDHELKRFEIGAEPSPDCGTHGQSQCGRCFVCSMVAVFREVRRVLRDDGTCWLNLGDSYSGGKTGRSDQDRLVSGAAGGHAERNATGGILPGNLVGVPWRVALALQSDGWVLRQDIIWHKPSPTPESVKNRCTKAHEYVFLLVKSARYFYDAEAVKDMGNFDPDTRDKHGEGYQANYPSGDRFSPGQRVYGRVGKRNKRSVWTVSSPGYAAAHFATFPPKLVEPCILAGTSERGACVRCGAPWQRVVEERQLTRSRPNDYVKRTGAQGTGNSCANTVAGVESKTVGWEPTCECGTNDVVPCTSFGSIYR